MFVVCVGSLSPELIVLAGDQLTKLFGRIGRGSPRQPNMDITDEVNTTAAADKACGVVLARVSHKAMFARGRPPVSLVHGSPALSGRGGGLARSEVARIGETVWRLCDRHGDSIAVT